MTVTAPYFPTLPRDPALPPKMKPDDVEDVVIEVTKVPYKRKEVELEKELKFVEPTWNVGGPAPPEPSLPPPERCSFRCSCSPAKWCLVMGGGIITTMIGFAAIMTLVDLWAGVAVGGTGVVVGIGGFIGHLVAEKSPGD